MRVAVWNTVHVYYPHHPTLIADWVTGRAADLYEDVDVELVECEEKWQLLYRE